MQLGDQPHLDVKCGRIPVHGCGQIMQPISTTSRVHARCAPTGRIREAKQPKWPNESHMTTNPSRYTLEVNKQTPAKSFREFARYLNFADRLTALHISWTKHSLGAVELRCKRLPAEA